MSTSDLQEPTRPEDVKPRKPSPVAKRIIEVAVSVVVVGVIFFVILPRVVDFDEVRSVLADLTWLEGVTLGLAAAWNLVTYWLLMMATLPRLSFGQAMVVTETSTAISNVLPGGPAFGMGLTYSMYSSWGFDRNSVALAIGVSGFADLFVKLAMPAVALIFIVLYEDTSPGLITASLIGSLALAGFIVVGWMTLRSDHSARRVGEALARLARPILKRRGRSAMNWGATFAAFRKRTITMITQRGWILLGASVMSHVSLFIVLLLALRHVGVSEEQIGWAEALGAFAFVRFLTALPLTPGGLGVIELGLSAALVYAGGPRAEVVAAVLVFRALTYLVQIPFGAITYLYWRHSDRWRPGLGGGGAGMSNP
ncbi:MAG: lysylphosphatidylglycerol synthase transmembrane domain-containing protein [Actinomycetota bacterium]